MNERILKLAEMHGFVNEHMTPGEKSDALKKYEKFAQLMVRECIDIAKNWEDQLEKAKLVKESNAVGIVAYRIARQFGVEE
jgi:hypothetical protein